MTKSNILIISLFTRFSVGEFKNPLASEEGQNNPVWNISCINLYLKLSYTQYLTPSGKKFKNIRANLVFAIQNNVNLYFYNVITIKRLGYIFAEHECTTPGYAWNPTHLYCYKYHTVKKPAENASTECSREDSRSHLFLVDSDNAFLFLQKILGIYKQNKVMTVKTFIHS